LSKPDETVRIESVGAQGDGVDARGRFVPFTLPGESVRARFEGARGEALEILEASPDRVEPVCRHFGDCGGCALQHWRAETYSAWKVDLARRALAREGLEPEFRAPFITPLGTRRRITLHARQINWRAALGFKARRTWRLVPVEACPVAHPRLEAAIPGLRALADPLFEHPKSAPALHATITLTGIDVDITGVERRRGGLSADAPMRIAEAAAAADLARVTLAGEVIFQARRPVVRFSQASVALPPGAFLQATAEAESAMAQAVIEGVGEARSVADLYCGVGTFALRLAERARVVAADVSAEAVAALKSAVVAGLKGVEAEARDLDRRPLLAEHLRGLDAVVIDPPRAGAEAQFAQISRSGVPTVVSVSCNPTTFARDGRTLADAGYRLEYVLPIDQFLYSPHLELVGVFRR
jgi:23S rRNA (uracil1939-C5)-methyltransferase